MNPPPRVVVTGLGVVSALGARVADYYDALLAGRSGVGPVTRFDPAAFAVRFAAQVTDFEEDRYLDRKDARRLDLCTRFAAVAARQAWAQSGLAAGAFDPDRAGCILGTGVGGLLTIEAEHDVLRTRGPGRISPFMIPKMMANAAAGQLSIDFDLRGPCFATVSACASANHAMGLALATLRAGLADLVVTGGAEAAVTPLALAGFASMKALSTRHDDPQRASRPFDRDRDGFVLGEGAGVLVFETEAHARARQATPLAAVCGFGQSADAHHITAPQPDGAGGIRALRAALADARLPPEALSYVNAHGTSTPYNDVTETRVLKAVFGAHARRLAVNSTKSMIGHALGAAGGLEAVATVMALVRQRLHPTRNLEHADPECDLDYVPGEARDATVEYAASNSLGFGGHNAVLIFGRA